MNEIEDDTLLNSITCSQLVPAGTSPSKIRGVADPPDEQARRSISRIFRMVTRFCGIVPSSMNMRAQYLVELPRGYNLLVGFIPERWSDCQRNIGRFQIGIAVGFTPECWSDSSGICNIKPDREQVGEFPPRKPTYFPFCYG